MAIITGTSASIINAPAVPGQVTLVIPELQAQDGSFVGAVGVGDSNNPQTNMVAFDATGNVRWVVPNETPQIATADGGVIGQSGITYDQNGNVTGTSQDPGGVTNWQGQFYNFGASGVQQIYSWVGYGAGFWSVAGGSPSGSATSVANVGLIEGLPLFILPQKIPCTIGSVKSFLGGQASIQYNHLRPLLLAGLQAAALPSSCSNFFNGQSGRPILGAVISAVTNQVPYAGPASNLSQYDAGEWTQNDTLFPNTWPSGFQQAPVCRRFFGNGPGGWSGTVATAQTQSPGTDAYYATQSAALQHLTQATILHEALHNLTGLGDPDLYMLLTGKNLPAGPTAPISSALVTMGCAAN
jgi:hypothetical protein